MYFKQHLVIMLMCVCVW